jgi:AraC-like DNA-binding protein
MSWTIALGVMLERDKQTYHYMFAGCVFCLGILQILDGLFIVHKLGDYSSLIFWHLPFLAWVGPLFFFSFKSANNDSFRLRPVDYLHFSCGLIIVPLLIPLAGMETATKVSFVMNVPDFTSENIMFRYYTGLLAAVILNLVGYLVYFIRESFFMLDIKLIREKKVSTYLIVIILLSFPLMIIFLVSLSALNLFENSRSSYFRIIQTLTALSFFTTLMIFIMEKKNINFFKILHTQIENRRYAISKIKNLDVALVLSQMKSLIEEKKIFIDEELTVNSLAQELGIEPYQLSQIINENFNKNFNYYINEYRIEEAKRMLHADMKRTITSVAYAVGFNSTTVFYEWFNRIAGVSPKKFRINNKK